MHTCATTHSYVCHAGVTSTHSYVCHNTGVTSAHLTSVSLKQVIRDHANAGSDWPLVPMCCSVLQCAAVCCIVLQCVAVCCSAGLNWPLVSVCCRVLPCCRVLQFVAIAVWCSVVQCGAVCCSVLQCFAVCCSVSQLAVSKCYMNESCHTYE